MKIYIVFFFIIAIAICKVTQDQYLSRKDSQKTKESLQEILTLTRDNFTHFYDPKLFRISSQAYDDQKDLQCKLKEGLYRRVKVIQSLISYHCIKDNFCIQAQQQNSYEFTSYKNPVSECLFSYSLDSQKEMVCKKLNGQYRKQGKAGFYSCLKIYSDGDTPCDKSSECESFCIIRSSKDSKGRCKANNSRFGCWGVIERGGIRCSD